MISKKIFFIVLLMSLFSACGQKKTSPSSCGEGTFLTGTGVGAVTGVIVGELTGARTASIILGAVVGGTHAHYLKNQQCKYYEKEQKLIEDVLQVKTDQSSLAKKINALSKEMKLLYEDIQLLIMEKNKEKKREEELLELIIQKRIEIKKVYYLNKVVKKDVESYRKKVLKRKYHKKDREILNTTLLDILKLQEQIASSCQYNLEQLEKFKKRILDV